MSQMDFVSIVSSAYLACLSREAYEAKAYKAVFSSQKDDMRVPTAVQWKSSDAMCMSFFFLSSYEVVYWW